MRINIDACSIILLAKATVLEEFSKIHELEVTEEVFSEVIEGKEKKFLDAFLTERLVKENRIKKIILKNKNLVNKLKKDFGLGDGEANIIALAVETNSAILTDNKQGRKIAKVYGLGLLGSPEVIVSLFKFKKINKNKAQNALEILRAFGWFDGYLIEHALDDIK